MNYLVVLFKDKEKRKIINKFKTYRKSIDFFNNRLKESDEVLFPKITENGVNCVFELGLIEISDSKKENVYIKDEVGRNIKVEIEDGFNILKINKYNIEEEFVDYNTKSKITTPQFLKKYVNKPGLKLVSKLNNKIVLQNDAETFLFTFKTSSDSDRFIDTLQEKINRTDCMYVKDYTTIHRKYLYNLLVEKGFSIKYLQRLSTFHPSKK
jgi:hypothetical protein